MDTGQEQLFLVADPASTKSRTRATKKAVPIAAEHLPIAQVRVDVSIAHLDRDFDYLVPRDLDPQAQIGAKIRVRFHGKLTDAIIIRRIAESGFEKLQPIERVIGPALTAETLSLVTAVTQRYAGLFWDVVRAAVPTKHGRTTAQQLTAQQPPGGSPRTSLHSVGSWCSYVNGELFLESLAHEPSVRACWTSAPSSDWRIEIQELVRNLRAANHDSGILVVVPDAKDVGELSAACHEFSPTILMAELGPLQRSIIKS